MGLCGGWGLNLHEVGWDPHDGISILTRRGRENRALALFLPWEHTGKGQLSACQEENSHKEQTWQAPWLSTFQLPNLWEINICCLHHSVRFSRSVMSNSLRPHGLQHARLPCPSPIPGACSDSAFWPGFASVFTSLCCHAPSRHCHRSWGLLEHPVETTEVA